jgi:hypothetical protein
MLMYNANYSISFALGYEHFKKKVDLLPSALVVDVHNFWKYLVNNMGNLGQGLNTSEKPHSDFLQFFT